MFCAVWGASAILEINRVTFFPASINPIIDAANDMGSMTDVIFDWARVEIN